jgi:hypothetical protein
MPTAVPNAHPSTKSGTIVLGEINNILGCGFMSGREI